MKISQLEDAQKLANNLQYLKSLKSAPNTKTIEISIEQHTVNVKVGTQYHDVVYKLYQNELHDQIQTIENNLRKLGVDVEES